jgi:DNA-binding transcriptional LysR family regulator
MELRHIRYFMAVAEELNFNRAARRLHMAQPPLSQQIKALEVELGVQLFHRDRRHVELSPAGKVFYPRAVEILERVQIAVEEARSSQQRLIGRLCVAIGPLANFRLLPDVIRDFQRKAPEARLNLVDIRLHEQPEALRSGRVDLCFLYPILGNDGFASEQLFMETAAVALPEGHPLEQSRCVSLKELAAERWLSMPEEIAPAIVVRFRQACQSAGFQPVICAEIESLEGRLQMVAAGAGITMMPSTMEGTPRPGISYVRLRENELSIPVGLIWRKNSPSALLELFLDCSRRLAAVLEPEPDACAG